VLTREQLDQLVDWKVGPYPVTSVYLDTDPRRHTGSEWAKVLESVVADKRREISQSEFTRDQQRWAEEDLVAVQEFVSSRFRSDGKSGLVVFASTPAGLWQALALPRPVSTQVVVDDRPWVRPLLVLADEFERFGAVVVDRRRGRIFDVFMGEIREIADVVEDVPRKTKGTGHLLKAEGAVTRHIGELWRHHYQNVADRALFAHRRQAFDHLVVGGPVEDVAEFEKTLHSTLQRRLVARISVQVGLESTPADVLRHVREVEQARAREREAALVDSLMTQAHSGKLGVVGLADTLKALRNGQVHTLVVRDGLRVEGVQCPTCRFVGVGERQCPSCAMPTRPAADVVDLAVAEAANRGSEVRHVFDARALDSVGGIGALLRYRA
jgi:peptide subunit release factor 1 (eRF1)